MRVWEHGIDGFAVAVSPAAPTYATIHAQVEGGGLRAGRRRRLVNSGCIDFPVGETIFDVLCCAPIDKRFLWRRVVRVPVKASGVSASTEGESRVEVCVVLPALSRACHRKPESVSRPAMATGSLNGGPTLASTGGGL